MKYFNNYENTAAEIALRNGYDYVVCGHIHHPNIQLAMKKERSVTYLNSGDWVENLSALEYNKGKWSIYKYYDDPKMQHFDPLDEDSDPGMINIEETNKDIFGRMLEEFKILPGIPRVPEL